MKRVFVVLAVLAGVLVVLLVAGAVVDQRIRERAEAEAGRRLGEALPIEGTPTVSIDSFPFVLRVLMDGSVEQLEVSMHGLESKGVTVDEARLHIEGLKLDRDQLIDAQHLEVVDIETARIDAWVTGADISKIAKTKVEVREGKVSVQYRGKTYTGTAKVSKHAVLVMVEGAPPILTPLPSHDLIPCEPDLDIDGDRIHVTCTVDALPPAVARVLARH